MNQLLLENKAEIFDESFCQKLTEKFNNSAGRVGRKVIKWKQVEKWFHNKQRKESPKSSPQHSDSKEVYHVPDSPSDLPEELVEKDSAMDFEFEALSFADSAWYDVGTFLHYRCLPAGEPEVRVRFHSFGPDHDEWVDVKKGVRPRSIPMEGFDCQKVNLGELTLCFREKSDRAAYFDAYVLEIERKLHDIGGCTCLFLVRYDHDQFEEKIPSSRICRRPC